ncbi:hypothetical protein BDA99DRAFT_530106, partial [Phascolomyces articulosus]
MWFLYKVDDHGQDTEIKILIRPGYKYSVGRKGTVILFNDKSVSRAHAMIIVGEQNNRDAFNRQFRPEVRLIDHNSKYGTFLNTKRVETETVLEDRDFIKFGSLKSVLRLAWEPVVVCIPSMSNSDKLAVAELACKLGIILNKEWDETCTHIYMKNIEIKAKLFLCMTSAKRIISNRWLEAFESQEDGSFVWPDESDYLPSIPRDLSISKEDCEPKPQRGSLFLNVEFWIFDKDQFDRYTPIIKSAQGKTKLCSLQVLYSVDELCAKNRLIIIPPDKCAQQFNEIVGKLAKRHKRAIKGDEISDAIIACSRDKHCNPTLPEEDWIHSAVLASIDPDEDEDIVVMSDLPPSDLDNNGTAQSNTGSFSSAVIELASVSMGGFFDDLLGDPEPSPHSLQLNEMDDNIPNRSPLSNHQNQTQTSPDSNISEPKLVPESEPVSRRPRRQLPGELSRSVVTGDNSDDNEPESVPSSIRSRSPGRQLPGQFQQLVNNDESEPISSPAIRSTRRSSRQLPGQLQQSSPEPEPEPAHAPSPTRSRGRPRRQLPGQLQSYNIGPSPEPETPVSPTRSRRTQRQTVSSSRRNQPIVEDNASDVPELTPSTNSRRTIRTRRQPVGGRSNNDEFPGLPNTEQENYNDEVPIISGKKYTTLLSANILMSVPATFHPREEDERDNGRMNFKRFKKVHQTTHYNPMEFITASLTSNDIARLRENRYDGAEDELDDSLPMNGSSVPDDGFADIEIRVRVAPRRGGR